MRKVERYLRKATLRWYDHEVDEIIAFFNLVRHRKAMFVKFVQAKRALLSEVELKVDFRAFLANIRRAAESVPFANFITAARVYLYAESIYVV